jgi:hypothetical protein
VLRNPASVGSWYERIVVVHARSPSFEEFDEVEREAFSRQSLIGGEDKSEPANDERVYGIKEAVGELVTSKAAAGLGYDVTNHAPDPIAHA